MVRFMPLADMDKMLSLSKRRGFVFQSSEIYGGLGSTWDYGPLGVELKRNVKEAWWRSVVTGRDDMVGLDAAFKGVSVVSRRAVRYPLKGKDAQPTLKEEHQSPPFQRGLGGFHPHERRLMVRQSTAQPLPLGVFTSRFGIGNLDTSPAIHCPSPQ